MDSRLTAVLLAILLAAAALLVWFSAGEVATTPVPAAPRGTDGTPGTIRGDAAGQETDAAANRTTVPAARDAAGAAGAAAPATADPRRLWGRVVRRAGETPVPGAVVRLLCADGDQFWNLDLAYGREVEELARATTGADGRFAFPVERSRKHRVQVTAVGFPGVTVAGRTGGTELVIALDAPATLDGLVVDKDSRAPIVDAAVRIAVRGRRHEVAKGRTDAAGRFHFADLPAVETFVQVEAPDYPTKWKAYDIRPGRQNTVTVEIVRGRRVTGKVVDKETKAPIAGVEIADSWTFGRSVRSDGGGKFVLGGLTTTQVAFFYARVAGYAESSRTIPVDFEGELVVEMVRGGMVTGRVVDAAGEAPGPVYVAAGASYMETRGVQHTNWLRAKVDVTGQFAVTGLRPDQLYWLYVRGRGYGTRIYALPRQVPSGERHDVGDITVRAQAGIEGRVVDETGAPRGGLSVSLRGMNHDARQWRPEPGHRENEVYQFVSRSVESDAGGEFRFAAAAGGKYTVSVQPKAHPRSYSVEVEVQDGALREGVVLTVPAGKSITGQLVVPAGVELPEHVLLTASAPDKSSVNVVVETDGRFRFAGLEDADYGIRMMGAPDGWTLPRGKAVAAGTEGVRLELVRAGRVSGRVVGPDDKGVRGRVWFRAEGQTGGAALHTTDAEGRFTLDVPPDFQGTVHAGYADASSVLHQMLSVKVEGVVAGQTDLVLRLPK